MGNPPLGRQGNFIALFDHLDGVALWTATEPETFAYLSDGFEDIWGIPPEEVQNDPSKLLDTIHPDDRDRVRANLEGTDGLDNSYEARIIRPDGSVRWVLTRQVILRNQEGKIMEVVGLSTDITEQKRREQELEMLNRIVRHDIRNDLTVLLGWTKMLTEHVDGEGHDYLEKMLTSGEHIVELTEIARNYSDAVVSEEELTTEPTPVCPILETVFSLREEAFPHAEFEMVGSLSDIEVTANRLLGSVFRNLINNAVQHNDKDTPVVEVSCELQDDDVVVRIADNGPGIPDERKEEIFGKGERGLDSAGTGVGLHLVYTLVTQYGGEVWVEDNDPTGTVFVVQLPKATDQSV